jgi:hypothetical protein
VTFSASAARFVALGPVNAFHVALALCVLGKAGRSTNCPSLTLDASAIFGGSLTLASDGLTPNAYVSVNTGAGIGVFGSGIGVLGLRPIV